MKGIPVARCVAAILALAAVPVLVGCGGKTVTRIDSDETVDLSGRWNDTDSRLVSEEMVDDCLSRAWIRNHQLDLGKEPVVVVGVVRNKSMEHIPVDTFIKDIERALINSGEAKVVADPGQRAELRAERDAQQGYVTPESLKRFGRELGADYVMMGAINELLDEEGGEKIAFYQTDLELINVETNEKVWIGQKKIKKYIGKGGYSK